MKAKNLKRSFLLSVLSLVLCISMFVGTTFAWFTDTVKSEKNKIMAGNLDIELYYMNDETADWTLVGENTNIFKKDALWEPGHTEVVKLKVVNEGTLALKYQLGVNIFKETKSVNQLGKEFKLSDYIKYGVTAEEITSGRDAAIAAVDATAKALNVPYTEAGMLQAKGESVVTMVVYMPTSVGNEANYAKNASIPEILLGLNLYATQLTSEHDSFGNDYDAMAGGYYHVHYGFSDPADLLAFAPTAGDAASSGLEIKDGKAQINKPGAWYEVEADLSENEYVVEYDIDITNLAVGENVTVDTGEQVGWGSTPIMLERGSTKVYYGLEKNEYLGELKGTVVHVAHIYKYNNDSKLEITTTVSDGEASITYTKAVASAAQTTLYWDIYFATEAGKATMDNFSVKAADAVVDSASELSSALAEGGKVVLTTDITDFEGCNINEDTVLDLNSMNVAGEKGINVTNGAKLSITNGTMEISSADGNAITLTNTEEGKTATLDLDDVVINFADVEGEYGGVDFNAIVVEAEAGKAVLNVNDGTELNVVADHATPIFAGKNSEINVKGGEINVENTLKNAYCVWGIHITDSSAVINVTGGVFNIRGEHSASGIYAYDLTPTVNISGGTFNVETSGGYGIGVEVYRGTVNATGGVFNIKATGGNAAYAFEQGSSLNLNVTDGVIINVFDGISTINAAYWNSNVNPEGCNAVINKMTDVAGYPGLYTDGTNYYVYDAAGLISMNKFWADNHYGNNMWGRSYNVMADIDATGYTWNEVYVIVGSNENNGFVFDGHGNTITGLTINGSLFSGTPNGLNKPENPGYVQDITFDGVKVVGNHFTSVLWSNVCNELVVKNVSVINSEITGKCNVAALVGGTVIDGAPDASVSFINCVVKNNVITAEGKNGQDPNGANVFLSRAYGNTVVTFENCVSEGNTITNNNGLVGGGIYGYTTWANGGFAGTGTCDSLTNWGGLIVANDVATLKGANGGNVALTGTVDLGGAQGNYLTLTENTTVTGGTIKGTGWTGELNYGVNATSGNIVFDGVTFDTTDWSTVGWAGWGISVNINGTANVTFKNCTFKGTQCPIYQSGSEAVVILENCTFESTVGAIQCEIYSGDFSLGQDLIVKNCDFTGMADVLHIYDYDKNPSTDAIVKYLTENGNTFTGVCKQTCQ